MSMATLQRWVIGLGVSGILLGLASAALLFAEQGRWLPLVVGAPALLGLPAWAWRLRACVAFWPPVDRLPNGSGNTPIRRESGDMLDPKRDWHTLPTFLGFMFVWMVLLGQVAQ